MSLREYCKHETSIWGRCADCGMTWDEQARQRENGRGPVRGSW